MKNGGAMIAPPPLVHLLCPAPDRPDGTSSDEPPHLRFRDPIHDVDPTPLHSPRGQPPRLDHLRPNESPHCVGSDREQRGHLFHRKHLLAGNHNPTSILNSPSLTGRNTRSRSARSQLVRPEAVPPAPKGRGGAIIYRFRSSDSCLLPEPLRSAGNNRPTPLTPSRTRRYRPRRRAILPSASRGSFSDASGLTSDV